MKKILSVLGNILLTIVIIVAVIMTISSLNTNDKGLPEIGGYMFMNIQSGSMEPTIKVGDMIVTKVPEIASKLKKDDIVSFVKKEQDTAILVTHRITIVNDDNGIISYVTKGDANDTVDTEELSPSSVVSVYQNIRIPFLGGLFTFLSSRLGFFIFIVLPLFALFVYQLYKFVATIVEDKKQDLIRKIREEQKRELENK